MTAPPRLAAVAIGRPTFDLELAQRVVGEAHEVLRQIDARLLGGPTLVVDPDGIRAAVDGWPESPDIVVVLQGTFTDSRFVAALARETSADLVLWSFPEARTGDRLRLNSLCGVNLAAYVLGRMGRARRHLHHRPEAAEARLREVLAAPPITGAPNPEARPEGRPDVDDATMARARAAVSRLARARVGVIGDPPDGFEACEVDSELVHRLLGAETDRIPLDRLFEEASDATPERLGETTAVIETALDGLEDLAPAAVRPSIELAAGLRTVAETAGLDAAAVRCWPECFDRHGGAACTPLAALAAGGTPGACEADAMGALTMLVMGWLAGSPAFLADLVDVDPADDTAVFWHCGVAPWSMAAPGERPAAARHPNREVPLTHEFALHSGRITVARFSQSRGSLRLVTGHGEALERPLPYRGTAATVRWHRPVGALLDSVVGEGLEHHYCVAYGDLTGELEAVARLLDLPVVHL